MNRPGLLALVLLAWLAMPGAAVAQGCDSGTIPSQYRDAAMFDAAIAAESGYPVSPTRLTGVTIPHHLVAARLMARGLRAASGHDYDRVVLLAPDHFRRIRTAATTRLDFDTVFGRVETDRDAAETLLASGLEEACRLADEHGVQALLPFIRHYLPGARVVPVVVATRSGRADWDRIADTLAQLVDERTIVVQSTDFSHYHPHEVARSFDQQTLNVLASGSLDLAAGFVPPDHMDTVGGMYIQMKLQETANGARPVAIASLNQQELVETRVVETTSYVVLLFGRFAPTDTPHEPGARVVYLAGDTLFGRSVARALGDPDAAERVAETVLAITRGRPLVVNLEGVILPNVPDGMPHLTLAMQEGLTIDWLRRLNVAAVGLANNHAMDLGAGGLAETTAALDRAGIPWFGNGGRFDLGNLSIVGMTDVESNGPPYADLIDEAMLGRLTVADATRPVAAFVHWGREYEAAPGRREIELADRMRLRGASLIVGAHPHVAGERLEALAGGDALMAYSLGNFLFDQSAARSSGRLLEVRLFEQGTYFARLIELPNLFDVARSAMP